MKILTSLFAVTLACVGQEKGSVAAPKNVAAELTEKLLKAKRIYVESFGEDVNSKTLQAMLVDALRTTNRFIVTENKERTDLLLKGASLEKTSQELHAVGSATSVATAGGSQQTVVSRSAGSSFGGFAARSLGTEDSQTSTETINDARAAVRLVSPDGDVVWSNTQESKGAKYKGAAADVADRIVKQLLRDLDKLDRSASTGPLMVTK
jgi:hypothetical protein